MAKYMVVVDGPSQPFILSTGLPTMAAAEAAKRLWEERGISGIRIEEVK